MRDAKPINVAPPPAGQPASFTWFGLALVSVAAPIVGLVWARVGQVAQGYFAPVILFPLLAGICTGLTVIGLVRLLGIGHRTTILLATVLATAVAGGGQHGLSYLARYHWNQPATAASLQGQTPTALPAELFRQMDPGFCRYLKAMADAGRRLPGGLLARGWAAWLSWTVDVLLVVAGGIVVTLPALAVPYCSRCRSWYRAIRNGKIDLTTAARLAVLLDVEVPERPRSARYRLSACQAGCGPSRFELSWESPDGVDLVRVWLDGSKRNAVAAVLDGFGDAEESRAEEDK